MNKKQRVLDCIDGKPIDKVPFSFWHHFQGTEAVGEGCVAAHTKIYDAAGMDFIKMNSNGFYPIDFGAPVSRPADWRALTPPKRSGAYFSNQIDLLRRTREATKDEACIFYVVFSAYSFLCQSYGSQLCDAHLRDSDARPHILAAMDRVADFVAELCAELVVSGGATGIFEAYSGNSRFTADEYRQWVRPRDERQLNACEAVSRYNIVHLCGGSGGKNHYEAWGDYTGSTIHWDQHLDQISLAEGSVLYPNKRAIMGGFDNRPGSPLYSGSRDMVRRLTHAYAQSGGATGYLLSADCTLAADVPYERLRWVGEALWDAAAG